MTWPEPKQVPQAIVEDVEFGTVKDITDDDIGKWVEIHGSLGDTSKMVAVIGRLTAIERVTGCGVYTVGRYRVFAADEHPAKVFPKPVKEWL